MSEIIRYNIINRYHNDPLISYFGIKMIKKLVARKYLWPSLRKDLEAYVKDCNVCLASKVVRHKLYGDLQSLLVPMHQ